MRTAVSHTAAFARDRFHDANASLIIHDAKVAAEIAVEYAGGKQGARRRMGY